MPVPSFEGHELPAVAKHPLGPYRQAPPEYGGRWYLVNPFQEEPWVTDVPARELPAGFVKLFGKEPQSDDFPKTDGGAAYRTARNIWEQALSTFTGMSIPAWVDMESLRESTETYLAWKMGEPFFYQVNSTREILEEDQDPDLTLRTLVRFPNSKLPGRDFDSDVVVNFPHLVVAAYQIGLREMGVDLEEVHPFVPEIVLGNQAA